MIGVTAQSSQLNNDVNLNDIGKSNNEHNEAINECSVGKNDNVGQGTNVGNGGRNGRENRHKNNNERENTNPNIFDQLSVSGQLLIVIILFYDDFDYIIFLVLQ